MNLDMRFFEKTIFIIHIRNLSGTCSLRHLTLHKTTTPFFVREKYLYVYFIENLFHCHSWHTDCIAYFHISNIVHNNGDSLL